jgi:hypothetical protein
MQHMELMYLKHGLRAVFALSLIHQHALQLSWQFSLQKGLGFAACKRLVNQDLGYTATPSHHLDSRASLGLFAAATYATCKVMVTNSGNWVLSNIDYPAEFIGCPGSLAPTASSNCDLHVPFTAADFDKTANEVTTYTATVKDTAETAAGFTVEDDVTVDRFGLIQHKDYLKLELQSNPATVVQEGELHCRSLYRTSLAPCTCVTPCNLCLFHKYIPSQSADILGV